ncbi:MAG: TraB/GumN family protein, partial [archaeon]
MIKNIDRIKVGNREIVLVGTAHVSKESIKLVNETILREKPDTVGVELCDKRYKT